MSRNLMGVVCAIAVVGGFLDARHVLGQDRLGEFVSESAKPVATTSEERIKSALEGPLKSPLDFTEVPLIEILQVLQEDYDIPIVLDDAALDELAISPDTEATINFRNISLGNALKLLLRQPGLEELTYVIDQEVLLVTTNDRAAGLMKTKVYRVDDLDLYPPLPRGPNARAAYSPLTTTITSCVEKSTWQQNGTGTGEIQLVAPGILVVSQTPPIHSQIEDLLQRIRKVRQDMASADASGAHTKFETRGFLVDHNLAESTDNDKKLITTSIIESVDWGDQPKEKAWVRFVGNRILVRHRIDVLHQVQQVIGQMGLNSQYAQANAGGGFGGGGGGGGAF
mgnify:CR=1 FL=1